MSEISVEHETIETKIEDWQEIERKIEENEKKKREEESEKQKPLSTLLVEVHSLPTDYESQPLKGGVKQYE